LYASYVFCCFKIVKKGYKNYFIRYAGKAYADGAKLQSNLDKKNISLNIKKNLTNGFVKFAEANKALYLKNISS
jgi:hypothetical protein